MVRSGDVAWGILGTAVVAYELTFEDVLSFASQRYCDRWPWLSRVIIFALAGHLAHVLPAPVDLLHSENRVHRRIAGLMT
jgi:hypothetical protein